jgi:endopeptidase La
MVMIDDIVKFVNYVNNSNPKINKKRPLDNLSIEEILIDIKLYALDKLKQENKSKLQLKGRKLTKYITGLKESFTQFIISIKTDKEMEEHFSELIRLGLIAQISVTINLLEEISKLAIKDRTLTFENFIENFYKKIIKLNKSPNKKFKSKEILVTPDNNDNNQENQENSDKLESPSTIINKKANLILIKLKNLENNSDSDSDSDYEEDSEAETSEDEKINNSNDTYEYDDYDDDKYYLQTDFNNLDSTTKNDTKTTSITFNKKEGREFISQIFKSKSEDDEDIILKYFSNLSPNEKIEAFKNIKAINSYQAADKPILFKIMELPLPISQKNHILKNYTELATSRHPENKLRNWFDSLMTIPFGQYKGINLTEITSNKVKKFIDTLQKSMDTAVYGHDEAKRQIIQIMGQQIRNPQAKGSILGIWGVPGNGKTSIIKEGIAKAMNKPFVFISLGGATDSSFLEGHSYTYEGSIYGRIVNGLITSKCMDPIFYFDELDKISKSYKGDEITNLLIHLTDPVQNSHFRDKYFHGIDIDLSRATIIFSFNDPHNVNPILMDRITTIETKYLMISQKIHIVNNYLLPEMMKDMGLKLNDINMTDDTIRYIVNTYTNEGGVRKLKGILYNICRELNLANLIKNDIDGEKVKFPFTVESSYLKTLLKHKIEIEHDKVHLNDKPGIVNGLWANSFGQGGILSIETMLVPSTSALTVKATGHLEKVIKESTEVATSLAWNYISEELKNKLLTEWKDRPMGIHIHCPDGATPKDGPSAGAALTIALYSLLTGKKIKHDIAMTGEINLEGKITAIGGLEEKLEGAKRAGVKLVLYPKENQKHINKIKERNISLIGYDFKVIPIESFDEVMTHALIN